MKEKIGWALLISYWILSLWNAINYSHLGYILGLIFVPFITIPLQVISSLFTDFSYAMIDVVWLGIGLLLLTKKD